MPSNDELTSSLYISVDGQEIEREVAQAVLEVLVDQNVHIPDYFSIRLNDRDLELLDGGPFDLTKEVEIKGAKEDGNLHTLIKGEITALEPAFNEGMLSELVVSGYDRSHRLYRETKSIAFINKKDSDLAEDIARAAGLRTDITQTSTVYDHIYQHNQSDLAFLMGRAWRIGFECFVSEGVLYFRRPPTNGSSLDLTWGQDLLAFQPRMTLAEQVDEVVVKGWDINNQAPIVGRAQNGNLYPRIQEQRDGANWASSFGTGKKVIVDLPVLNQAEADALATARLDEISGAFIQASGRAFRRPDIKPGISLSLQGLGNRFSGSYMVTSARHVYHAAGLYTTFEVSGARSGLLSEDLGNSQPVYRWPGVVPAVVTNTDDPNNWGRVKVRFPWMTEDAESDWARLVGAGAGPQAGICLVPEVGDEVLVGFVHGDFGQPIVLGGLWNGQNPLPSETADAAGGDKPLVRTWCSRNGHRITISDVSGDEKIEIVDSSGNNRIVIDSNSNSISIAAGSGDIEVQVGGKLKLNGNGIEIKSQAGIEIEASANVDIKGAMINLN